MIDNEQNQALFSKKSFWLIVFIPAIVVLVLIIAMGFLTNIWQTHQAVWVVLLSAVTVYILLAVPLIVIMLFIERNQLAREHNQLLRAEVSGSSARLHAQQFVEFMPADLCKRLGISPIVIHRLFFPRVLDGDLAINAHLLRFIHHGFAQLAQASEVVEQLADSEDEDEQAVKHNRLAFIVEHSVGLMYFIAEQSHGESPDCKEAYFVKDALADYADLIKATVAFSMVEPASFDLSGTFALFDDKQYQGWFNRNRDLLVKQCKLCTQQNPFAELFKQWR